MSQSDTPPLASTFDESYFRGGTRSHYTDYEEAAAWSRVYWFPLIDRYQRAMRIGPPGRALDVGCAFGFLVRELSAHGWQAEGCDVSEYSIEQGHRQGIAAIRAGSLDALAYPSGSFDLVTCLDVIEHLPPAVYRAYIREFLRVLAPGGMLFVATPNRIDCSGYNIFSPDFVERDETHINYRSRQELLEDFSGFDRRFVHGATPKRAMFESYRSAKGLPRPLNGAIRWLLWRSLGNDPNHSLYLLLVALRAPGPRPDTPSR